MRSLTSRLSSHCNRGLVHLRQHSRALCRHAAGLRLSPGVAGGTTALVVASAAAGAPGLGGQQPQRSSGGPLEFGSPLRRVTDSLLVLNGLLFLANWASKDLLLLWGAKINSSIAAGQLWRLLTCSFLHTSAVHLLINSYALATIGPHAEMLLGRSRFTAVYIASALLGSTASFLLTPAPSLGASGALFGLGASLGVFYWRHRHSMGRRSEDVLQQLGVSLAMNVVYGLMVQRVDNWSHIGGLLGGALLSWLLGPRLVRGDNGSIVDKPPLPLLAHKPFTGRSHKH